MRIIALQALLKNAHDQGAREVKCAVDEEWNEILEVAAEIDADTNKLVIFPVNK